MTTSINQTKDSKPESTEELSSEWEHSLPHEHFRSQTGDVSEIPKNTNRFSVLQEKNTDVKDKRQSGHISELPKNTNRSSVREGKNTDVEGRRQSRKRSLSPLSKSSQISSSKLPHKSQSNKSPSKGKSSKQRQRPKSNETKRQSGSNIPVIGTRQ